MKLMGVLALSGVMASNPYETPATYQLRVKPIYHMNILRVDRAAFSPLFRDASTPTELEKAQADHLEVQLKQMFWIIHGFRDLSVESVVAAWDDFQHKILHYGCHCFVNGYTVGGAGPVQDKIDLACIEYGRCAKCIQTDRVDGYFNDRPLEVCTTETPYYSKLNKDYTLETEPRIVECGRGQEEGGKQSRCQLANCYCDRALAYSVAAWWHKHDIGKKNVYTGGSSGICQNSVSGLGPPTGCCGMYPTRRSFWVANGRECCGTQVKSQNPYQIADQECCDEGTGITALLGTCPVETTAAPVEETTASDDGGRVVVEETTASDDGGRDTDGGDDTSGFGAGR